MSVENPSPGQTGSAGGSGPGPGCNPSPQKAVPYSQKIPGGVENKLITIVGTINPNPGMITVNMLSSNAIAFHFNPRFNYEGRKVIIMNSWINKTWGEEERDAKSFPFVPGQQFEIKISCTEKEYNVTVNGSHLLTYKHRVKDLETITELKIKDDLTLRDVCVETLP